MKRRFVKLAFALTVVTIFLGLFSCWPYWHPMWWNINPPVDVQRVRSSVSNGLQTTLSDLTLWNILSPDLPTDRSIKSVDLVAWTDDSDDGTCLALIHFLNSETRLLVVLELDGSEYVPDIWMTYDAQPLHVDMLVFLQYAQSQCGSFDLAPAVWKRITGEVLTPSRVRQLQALRTKSRSVHSEF